jgi:GntR family transcriptional regulator/MocR family aminotransferase
MRAPDGIDTQALANRLRTRGVLIEPGQSFFGGTEQPQNFYRLGYSSIPASQINEGLKLLASEIDAMTKAGHIPL